MITALVTGAGALLGQGIVRSLQGSTIDARIVTADPSALSAGLYWGDRGYLIERADSEKYMERLEEVLSIEKPDVVMVGTDVELDILSRNKEYIEQKYGSIVIVSDPRVIAIADDKYLTFEFFKAIGANPPESALPEHIDALERLIEKVGFPLIVKPRIGARAVGVSKVNNRSELDAALRGRAGLVVQECVGNEQGEYTAGAVVFEGSAKAAIVMRRDLRDGNTYRAYVDNDPMLHAAVCEFGAKLNPFGPVNFQFRVDQAGVPRVFEINGRFSGTTPLRALAGFNEVEMCILYVLYQKPIVQPKIEDVTILRHWSETVIRSSDMERVR